MEFGVSGAYRASIDQHLYIGVINTQLLKAAAFTCWGPEVSATIANPGNLVFGGIAAQGDDRRPHTWGAYPFGSGGKDTGMGMLYRVNKGKVGIVVSIPLNGVANYSARNFTGLMPAHTIGYQP